MQTVEVLLFNTPESVFVDDNGLTLTKGQRVVLSTPNGQELGVVKQFAKDQSVDNANIIRLATENDNKKHLENIKYARQLLPEIKQLANDSNLDMKIGFISVNLDRSKIVVNYTADERVDFREFIKILGGKYKSRIEMKQIGNRDETKCVGALGVCGRETCCKSFLSDFNKVSVKMAKNQNIALNPTRINGMCGRLLCCLKYEDEFYEDMQKKMPKINSFVTTLDGKGQVTSTDFLRETVTVTFTKDDTTEVKTFDLTEIKFGAKDKNE